MLQNQQNSNDFFNIPSNDLNSIYHVLDIQVLNHYRNNTKNKCIKKLNDLKIHTNNNDLIVNSIFVTHRSHQNHHQETSRQTVFDLSKSLDEKEINLLGKGLKFGIQNRNFNHFEILTRFEELAQNLKDEEIRPDISASKANTTPVESFMSRLQFLAEEYSNSSQIRQNSLNYDEEKTLLNLKKKVKEKELIINKADKGNAAVITEKCEYIKKVEQLFSDPTKFKIIDDPDPQMIQKLEKSFNDNLHFISDVIVKENDPNYRLIVDANDKKIVEIKTKGSINQNTYKQLRSAGAKCAVAYGTTKVHKKDYPIRPIISTIGTYNYATAGYLSMILEENFNAPKTNNSTDNINSNVTWNPPKKSFKYALKDTFDFINKVSDFKFEENDFIISIDVESLFTNVPIDETIKMIKDAFFKEKSEKVLRTKKNIGNKNIRLGDSQYEGNLNGLPWEHFEYLLRNCLQESIFTFNNKLFKQIDGVSMGSRLGPIIANIFMDYFECQHINELTKLGVKLWLRYVDDTFVVINNKNQADKILDYLNKCHPTIKFTIEKETNNEINFLDVKIKRELDGTITTSTYRKPTFTGVMLNWNSLTSIKYKKGLIGCLLDRSYKICSNNQQRIIEMEELRDLLLKNNYPQQIIQNEFDKFEKYKMINVDKVQNPKEKIKYLSIPFINDKSEIIGRKIQEAVKEHFTNINLRVAFKSPATLGSHFPFKDKVTDPSKLSMVVYHLKCKNCNADYIGQTKRICDVRMKDHQTDKNSHVFEHHNIPGHEIDFENVEILDRADTVRKLEYKEMLYIRKHKPTINKQTEGELFTLIIRNVKLDTSMERDVQKYLNNKKTKNKNFNKK